MKIYLATISDIKLKSAHAVLNQLVTNKLVALGTELVGEEMPSKMPETPHNAETLIGARNRSLALYEKYKDQENCIYVGLESGLVKRYNRLFEECWCYVLDNQKKEYLGYSSGIALPEIVTGHLKNGGSHVQIMTELENKYSIFGKDTWGIYTKNYLSRTTSVEESFRNALLAYLIKH